ncbi:MAG: hypothetical protein SXQ77_02450, partial [Halobacteria archaeon]|nr:hypothetical protein [Halobacteria archaeon]
MIILRRLVVGFSGLRETTVWVEMKRSGMAEFSSEVTVDDIVVRDSQTSTAVDDPIRATILDM